MAKHFTLEQARRVLPEVEAALKEAVGIKSAFTEAESELQGETQRIMMLGGSLVDRQKILSLRGRRDACASRLKEAIEAIHGHGCLVKDLDMGLIDFPTFYRGEEVYICWKLGEKAIEWWHGIHEGFRGRKPIDEDFIEHHQGDRPN
jgi:hypothetical protein